MAAQAPVFGKKGFTASKAPGGTSERDAPLAPNTHRAHDARRLASLEQAGDCTSGRQALVMARYESSEQAARLLQYPRPTPSVGADLQRALYPQSISSQSIGAPYTEHPDTVSTATVVTTTAAKYMALRLNRAGAGTGAVSALPQ